MSISFLALWERLFTSHVKKNVSLYPPTKHKNFPQNRYTAACAATIGRFSLYRKFELLVALLITNACACRIITENEKELTVITVNRKWAKKLVTSITP